MIDREKMLCCFLLLFTLTSCVSGSPVVKVTYQAEENHNVTIDLRFFNRTDGSLNSTSILCELSLGFSLFILFDLYEGGEVSGSQDERFAGRVQVDKDGLRRGRLRLHVSRLRTDDSGDYSCRVNTGYDDVASTAFNLKVVTAARDRTKPETPSTTSGGGDPSQTGSASQPESRGRIGLFYVLGAGTLLVLCSLFVYRTISNNPFLTRWVHPKSPDCLNFTRS